MGRKAGHDAIECNGICSAWPHRGCAGLSKVAFVAVSKSSNPSTVHSADWRNSSLSLTPSEV